MTRILITGAAGMVGRVLVAELSDHEVIATDLRPDGLPEGARFERMDVTGSDPAEVIARVKPEVIVHLASIVTPPPGMGRETGYAVDVTGTKNVLDAAIANGVRRLVVTSSGAAYGYHADNPVPLRETDPCRGNVEFAYSDHKRQVEEMLAAARADHPELEQVVLRVGTVLGKGTENQITALFHKPKLLALRGYDSPFVFIWTRDLARILIRAATDGPAGIFNVAGDGAMSVDDLAQTMGKPVRRVPAGLIKLALGIAHPLRLSRYGPEQVRFLQYRPVLANDALKTQFGYVPELSSAEVFDLWQGGGPVKTAVISGGNGGLGRALALALQARGWFTVLMDRDVSGLAETPAQWPVQVDLTDSAALTAAMGRIILARPSVDLVIYNAGVSQIALFDETPDDTHRRVFEINYFAAVAMARGFQAALRKVGGTHLAISSVAGFSPLYKRTAYAASKHAVEGFFGSLRSEEARHGVKVQIAAPSFVATNIGNSERSVDGVVRPGSAKDGLDYMTPEEAAGVILKGYDGGAPFIPVGRIARLSWWINRLSPKLFERLMVKKISGESE